MNDVQSEASESKWEKYGWQLAEQFLATANQSPATSLNRCAPHVTASGILQNAKDLRRALHRRSGGAFALEPIAEGDFRALLNCLLTAMSLHRWLVPGILVQDVAGMRSGSYLLHNQPTFLDIRRAGVDNDSLMRISQGQGFVNGGGCTIFLGVDWTELRTLGGNMEGRYRDVLVEIGSLGHSLVLESITRGMETRMTPAIHEGEAASMFELPAECEFLYLLKVGWARG